jgi:putative FmdB family regulatory protein
MPLYEYECRSCGNEFELLVRSGTTPSCPECGSAELARRLSGFGVKTDATSKSAFAKAKQDRKKADRDRVIAERERIESHHH